MMPTFEETYPAVSRWIKTQGWIELGAIEGSPSLVRVLDEGGLIWESAPSYPNLDQALQATEVAISQWWSEQLGTR
jgi:hypothetical protein